MNTVKSYANTVPIYPNFPLPPSGHNFISFLSIFQCFFTPIQTNRSLYSLSLLFHTKGGLHYTLFCTLIYFNPLPTIHLGHLSTSAHGDSLFFCSAVPGSSVRMCSCLSTPPHPPESCFVAVWWMKSVFFFQPPWTTCTYRPPHPAATAVTQRAAWAPTHACTPSACPRPTARPEPWPGPRRPSPVLLSSQRLMWVFDLRLWAWAPSFCHSELRPQWVPFRATWFSFLSESLCLTAKAGDNLKRTFFTSCP